MAINDIPEYKVDTNTQAFRNLTEEKNSAIKDSNKIFDDTIKDLNTEYDEKHTAAENYKNEQLAIQNELYNQTVTEINQQKAQAEKDYTKEQSAAYTDWQKQSNDYGVKSEEKAAMGLSRSGYSESSKVAMYNQYQTRVTTARESYTLALQNYNNMMTNARIQNSSALAKIAYDAFVEQSTMAIDLLTKKSSLLLEQAREKREIEKFYQDKWNDAVNLILQEYAINNPNNGKTLYD